MARVVALGSAAQSIYLSGEPTAINKITYAVNGGGVIAATACARHGHEVILMGNIAQDAAGYAIIKTLAAEGIDSSYLNFLERRNTGTMVVWTEPKKNAQTVLTYAGASEQFGNLDEKDLELINPDWLYVSTLGGDLDTAARFCKKAKSLGAKIMLKPGLSELEQKPEMMKLLKYADVLHVNKAGAARLVPGTTLLELLYHLNGYVETTIITDGAMGGIAGNRQESYRFGIYEDVKVKDRTGAGDAFAAGFLAHFADEKSLRSSLIFASANATSVITKIGANHGILTGNEKLHLMPIQKI